MFIRAALPGAIRLSKEYRHFQTLREQFMFGEFLASVEGGAAALLERELTEKVLQLLPHPPRFAVLGGSQQHEPRFAIDQRHHRALMIGARLAHSTIPRSPWRGVLISN